MMVSPRPASREKSPFKRGMRVRFRLSGRGGLSDPRIGTVVAGCVDTMTGIFVRIRPDDAPEGTAMARLSRVTLLK